MKSKTIRVLFLLTAFLTVSAGTTWSQDLKLLASVDRTRVSVGQVVSLTVRVEGAKADVAPAPEIQLPQGMQVVGTRSSSSTSIRIVNGQVSNARTTTRVYSIRADREGTFRIGPASVELDNRLYRSEQIRVDVVPPSAASGGGSRVQPTPGAAARPQAETNLGEIEQNLFIRASSDRPSAYVGEQVLVSYELYTRYQINNIRFGHLPTYTGFWAETVFDANTLDLSRETVDGRAYNRAALKRVSLFATTTGTHDLEQLEVICDIPVGRRRSSRFDTDDFFGWDPFRTQQVRVRSDDLKLEILPLPPGAPANFGGAVGDYAISASANLDTVREGDPITVVVTVTGRGNLNAVPTPSHALTDAFRFYDPTSSVESHFDGEAIRGTKTFEFVVIPQVAGDSSIPPLALSFFDPEREEYFTVRSEPIPLTVTPAAAASGPVVTRESVRVLGEDIRYIKGDATYLEDQSGALYRNSRFLFLQLVPAFGLLAAFGWRRHRRRLAGDAAYARRRRSRGEAQKQLAAAKRLMEAGDSPGFHAEIALALSRFLGARLDTDNAAMTGESAAVALAERGVQSDLSEAVTEVFRICDFARFAPGEQGVDDMRSLYARAETLISELERAT